MKFYVNASVLAVLIAATMPAAYGAEPTPGPCVRLPNEARLKAVQYEHREISGTYTVTVDFNAGFERLNCIEGTLENGKVNYFIFREAVGVVRYVNRKGETTQEAPVENLVVNIREGKPETVRFSQRQEVFAAPASVSIQ